MSSATSRASEGQTSGGRSSMGAMDRSPSSQYDIFDPGFEGVGRHPLGGRHAAGPGTGHVGISGQRGATGSLPPAQGSRGQQDQQGKDLIAPPHENSEERHADQDVVSIYFDEDPVEGDGMVMGERVNTPTSRIMTESALMEEANMVDGEADDGSGMSEGEGREGDGEGDGDGRGKGKGKERAVVPENKNVQDEEEDSSVMSESGLISINEARRQSLESAMLITVCSDPHVSGEEEIGAGSSRKVMEEDGERSGRGKEARVGKARGRKSNVRKRGRGKHQMQISSEEEEEEEEGGKERHYYDVSFDDDGEGEQGQETGKGEAHRSSTAERAVGLDVVSSTEPGVDETVIGQSSHGGGGETMKCPLAGCRRVVVKGDARQCHKITAKTRAGNRDWTDLIGYAICSQCYHRYSRSGPLVDETAEERTKRLSSSKEQMTIAPELRVDGSGRGRVGRGVGSGGDERMESFGERWGNTGGGEMNGGDDVDKGEEEEDGGKREVGDKFVMRGGEVPHSTGVQSTSSLVDSTSAFPPCALRCPVTKLEVVDPVLCVADGCVYERVAIEELLRLGRPSPVNGQVITRLVCMPHPALKESLRVLRQMRHDLMDVSKRARVAEYAIQQARLEEVELEKKRIILQRRIKHLGQLNRTSL